MVEGGELRGLSPIPRIVDFIFSVVTRLLSACSRGLILFIHPFEIESGLLGCSCEVLVSHHLHRYVFVDEPDFDVFEIATGVSECPLEFLLEPPLHQMRRRVRAETSRPSFG